MKVVLNKCYGGFSLSNVAADILGISEYGIVDRTDSALIEMIEEKGSELVSGRCAKLKIVNIPDNITDWVIDEYDGIERIIYVENGHLGFA